MKQNKSLIKKTSSNHAIWSLVGGTALLLAATLVLITLPDIKRYIRISTM